MNHNVKTDMDDELSRMEEGGQVMKTLRQSLWEKSVLLLSACALTGSIGCASNLDRAWHTAGGADRPLTAEEHLVAAGFYDREAQSQAAAATEYDQRAEALSPLMDPKGFRRSGLVTAAQEHRRKAGDMQQLYVFHQNQALELIGQAPRQ